MENRTYARSAPAYLLTILRIYLGVILLYTVIGKLFEPKPFSEEMLAYLKVMMDRGRMTGFYHRFLQSTVIPNARVFSNLVITGELTAGIGLLTGTLTRISAFIAGFLFINYMLSKGRWFWSPDSEDAAVFFISLVLMLGRAGRSFGVDRFLAAKRPHGIFW